MKIIFIKSKFKRKILWKTLKRYEIKKMIEIGFDHVSLATLDNTLWAIPIQGYSLPY